MEEVRLAMIEVVVAIEMAILKLEPLLKDDTARDIEDNKESDENNI